MYVSKFPFFSSIKLLELQGNVLVYKNYLFWESKFRISSLHVVLDWQCNRHVCEFCYQETNFFVSSSLTCSQIYNGMNLFMISHHWKGTELLLLLIFFCSNLLDVKPNASVDALFLGLELSLTASFILVHNFFEMRRGVGLFHDFLGGEYCTSLSFYVMYRVASPIPQCT